MHSKKLSNSDLFALKAFSQSCRSSIIEMVTNAQSGHPGGSLGCVDYLSFLYTHIISHTKEKVVVSNGHISPVVYAVLAELGVINKQEVIKRFRQFGTVFEGHVTRHVRGVDYGTGPLGAGVSAAAGFALAEKLQAKKGKQAKRVYALMGDGESQEGQVYEMMNFASKYALDNFIVFMDYNQVQLSDSLKKIMPIDPKKFFHAAGWNVIDVNGHSFSSMHKAMLHAQKNHKKPTLLLGHTIMGKGVELMEQTGRVMESTWHGKAPTKEQSESILKLLVLKPKQQQALKDFLKELHFSPKKPEFPKSLSPMKVNTGVPRVYTAEELTDCRTAYGNALLDLAKKNKQIIALTADVAGSVKTNIMGTVYPNRHIECGIAEQHMVSCSGGLSLSGMIPFCSTFGAFMTSRAKDQARVNDINRANVKMVATHCGLSVGQDGPTHQAIDDSGSILGLLNTLQIEPADPNHCDRIIRYIASHYGNFYVRMGRHKLPVLTKENGKLLYDKNYTYNYGKCDVLRKGEQLTVVASGSVVSEALKAVEELKEEGTAVELVIASSIKQFDNTLFKSIQKTGRVLTVEDHNTHSGLGSQLAATLTKKGILINSFTMLGVDEYQLSGEAEELYQAAGISSKKILQNIQNLLKK